MTAERDRLAALLHDVSIEAYGQKRWAQAPWPTDMYDWLADRLIAAGVVTPEPPVSDAVIKEVVRGLIPDLDVERLARALQADDEMTPHYCTPVGTPCSYCTAMAHRIAAAYREDATIAERDG